MMRDRFPVSERWFRLLLNLYPPDFRDEMGDAIVEAYRARASDAVRGGRSGLLTVWIAALVDSLRNGLGERMHPAVAWRRAGDWGRDLERVQRRLGKKPFFVASVLATLTVGLGAFAVVYTAVDKILLEPLPYAHPEDLYMVWRKTERFVVTGPEAAQLRTAGGVIERAAIIRWASFSLAAGPNTDALRLRGLSVSPELFDVLGVRPRLGRGFRPEETGPAAPNVIVLSDGLWRRLGADPGIVGRTITIAATPFTVIGVTAAGFNFSGSAQADVDAYLPLYDDLPVQPPLVGDWMPLVRARPGTPPALVQQAVDRISESVDTRLNDGKRRGLLAVNLHDDLVGDTRAPLLTVAAAAAFLILTLTANLAALLLAKAAAREKEFAIARALGASGLMIVRATLLEGGVLGLAGGVTGTVAGIWGLRLLLTFGPADLPRREAITLDWGVAVVVIAAGVTIGLLAAAAPAIWASCVSLPSMLATASVRGGVSSGRLRRGLIVVQVALSLVLLSAGGLMVRSFERLLAADPGFRPGGVLTFGLGLGNWLFPDDADSFAFEDRVEQALTALPGIERVSATTTLPLSGGGSISWVYLPDRVPGGTAGYRVFVRAGYPETIGMRLIEGHTFDAATRGGVHEALIDRRMARYFFGDRSPLGAMIMCDSRRLTIVGVVEQPRIESLHRADSHPQIFMRAEDHRERPWRMALHTTGDPAALIPEVQTIVRRLDRRVPISNVETLDSVVAARRSQERTSAIVIAGLAIGALLLVAMGLFGMVSGSVVERRGELALRLALGATHQQVIYAVVRDGARMVASGALISIPGIYLVGRALSGMLIEVSPFDALTLAAVTLGLAGVTLLACYVAAKPAAAIAPERLLRDA